MKILIVDDELAVKESLEIMIDRERYGITKILYAQNGREALHLLETEKPEILFCDMQMPVMDGKQLLEEIKRREIHTKVIAVSGYSDFPYVKATIQVQGIDYLLKPIDEEEIDLALEKAVNLCKEEKEEISKEHQYQKRSEEVSVQYLREWLNGKQKYDDSIATELSALGMQNDHIFSALIILQNPLKIREDLFQGDGALMSFTLVNIMKEIFEKNKCQLIDIDEFLHVLLVNEMSINAYEVKLNQFLAVIKDMYELKAFYECSNEIVSGGQVLQQVEKMKYHLLSRKIVQHENHTTADVHQPNSFKTAGGLLYSAIIEQNMQGLNAIITEICDGLAAKPDLTLRELQFYTAEMNLVLRRLIHENLKDYAFETEPISSWILDLKIWEEVLKDRVYKIAKYRPGEQISIEAVYRYLNENYAEDISIHTLTEYFHQSPQYISKQFKTKYDMTIVTALRQIRMEQAKKFLENTSDTIIEIARKTGYEDDNYFSKVFKKEYGISPKNYRNTSK